MYLRGCAVSGASTYETPVGDITVDVETCKALLKTGNFEKMSLRVDEEEHCPKNLSRIVPPQHAQPEVHDVHVPKGV